MTDMAEARKALISVFPGSFINERDEFIAHPRTNQYFILADCVTPEDIAIIYQAFGNRVNHRLTMEFIDQGMDIGWLRGRS